VEKLFQRKRPRIPELAGSVVLARPPTKHDIYEAIVHDLRVSEELSSTAAYPRDVPLGHKQTLFEVFLGF
jgi:hypothetical protein